MTGRDLILYILENGLENEPIVKDGTFIGFFTVGEVAIQTGVGTATIYAWMKQGRLPYVSIGNRMFIPYNYKLKLLEE